jgi:adenylate cyclase
MLCLLPNYAMQAKHQTARELSEQTFSLAQRTQDPALLIEAHYTQGSTLLWVGEFAAARTHFEQGLALYEPQQHSEYAFRYGHDPCVACFSQLGQVLWLLGYPAQALQSGNAAITLAQELSHLNSLGFALDVAAMIHQLRREWQETQERAEATIKIGTEQGFPYWVAQGTMFLGWAVAEQGEWGKGLELLRRGFAAQRAIGGRILEQYWLTLQIEAHLRARQIEQGIAALAEAFTVAENGERIWEAEVYRLKGKLMLEASFPSPQATSPKSQATREVEQEAEECFHKAIEIAQKQQAKSLELRATMSLTRLWQKGGKRAEAHKLLSEVYNWFTEGFDTKDLQEAKEMLEELSH